MTDQSKTPSQTALGEAAVDGLLAGEVAGLGMALYLVLVGLFMGNAPATVLSQFDAAGQGSALVGGLSHLAVSGVYGALFGAGWKLGFGFVDRVPVWVVALIYGLVLWVVAWALVLPISHSAWFAAQPIHFVIAHLIYGVTLGGVLARK